MGVWVGSPGGWGVGVGVGAGVAVGTAVGGGPTMTTPLVGVGAGVGVGMRAPIRNSTALSPSIRTVALYPLWVSTPFQMGS